MTRGFRGQTRRRAGVLRGVECVAEILSLASAPTPTPTGTATPSPTGTPTPTATATPRPRRRRRYPHRRHHGHTNPHADTDTTRRQLRPTPTATATPTPAVTCARAIGRWTLAARRRSTTLRASRTMVRCSTRRRRVTPGKVGSHALAVDGVTPFDYALVPDHASLDITNAITLAAWVKPEVRRPRT